MLEDVDKLGPKQILQLIELRRLQKDATMEFGEAIKAGAKLGRIKPSALRKYIAALDDDKVDAVKTENLQVEMLIANTPRQLSNKES